MNRLLIVEDDEFQRELFAMELEEDGYEILQAANGFEALAVLKSENVDAVVMDLRMPGMDGIELLGHLHNLPRRIPVIVYTAYAQSGSQFATWAADALITKSISIAPLKDKIRELLSSYEPPQRLSVTTVTPSPPSPLSPGLKPSE